MIDQHQVFDKGWKCGLPETPCGWGSTFFATENIRRVLPIIICGLGIQSIADIGCGDMNWIKHTNLAGASYQGYDLVPRHDDVIQFDILKDLLPRPADLVICRDLLFHFPNKEAQIASRALERSGTYVLTTTYLGIGNDPRHDWIDDPHKCFAPINLQADPFNLPEPILLIPDCGGRHLGLWNTQQGKA